MVTQLFSRAFGSIVHAGRGPVRTMRERKGKVSCALLSGSFGSNIVLGTRRVRKLRRRVAYAFPAVSPLENNKQSNLLFRFASYQVL